MATFQNHFRSISLPARLTPINSSTFEAELQKLKASAFSQSVPITSETIQSNLLELAELYSSVEELTQSTTTQQSFLHQDRKSLEESLEGSVELLDSCNTIRELVQMIKENVQSLQSALRRKGPEYSSVQNYFYIRKKMNKCIAKGLRKLKCLETRNGSSNISLTGLTIAIFMSVLVFLTSNTAQPGGWNLVSKLMLTKSAASVKDHSILSELGCVDFALSTLLQGKSRNSDMQMVQSSLHNLDACIQGIEAGLERLFRELIQSRVRLLNILTHL